jgi:putative regulator of septum formation
MLEVSRLSSRRRLRLPVFLVTLGVLVTSCANPAPVGLPSDRVRVGTCKLITVAEEMVAASDVSPAVPCSAQHTYEAYDIASIPGGISRWTERPQPELLQAELRGLCPYQPIRPYLGADALDSQWGISVWQKAPTRAEWKRHVRVLVCDLVVDTPIPGRPPLTRGSLRNIMRYSDSARLRLCRSGQPLVNVTCNLPHTGEKMGTVGPDPKLKPSAVARTAVAACRARVREYTGATSLSGYRAGITITSEGHIECWLNSTTGDVTGTRRAGLVHR